MKKRFAIPCFLALFSAVGSFTTLLMACTPPSIKTEVKVFYSENFWNELDSESYALVAERLDNGQTHVIHCPSTHQVEWMNPWSFEYYLNKSGECIEAFSVHLEIFKSPESIDECVRYSGEEALDFVQNLSGDLIVEEDFRFEEDENSEELCRSYEHSWDL